MNTIEDRAKSRLQVLEHKRGLLLDLIGERIEDLSNWKDDPDSDFFRKSLNDLMLDNTEYLRIKGEIASIRGILGKEE